MIHDIFSPIVDIQMAKTCSEIFTGDYHYIQKDRDEKLYGRGREILLNSEVELLAAQVTYVEASPLDGRVWTPIKFATSKMSTLPSRADIVASYKDSVGTFQSLATSKPITAVMSSIPLFTEGGWPAVRDWHASEVATKGRSLLTAHFLGRVANDHNALVDTIVYPDHVRQKLRQLARDMFIATLPNDPPDIQAITRSSLIDNEQLYTVLGNITACQQLFSVKTFNNTIEPYVQ